MTDRVILGCGKSFKEADIVVFGAPYDGTASFRPGSRFAPGAMRTESHGLETYSPYFHKDLETDACVHDAGDLELPFGNRDKVLEIIRRKVMDLIRSGKRPFMMGGDHLVTYPAVMAVSEAFPELHLLHFDAHADLRQDYLGEWFSHSTVIRRVHDLLGDGKIFQFGIRSGTKSEFQIAECGRVYAELFTMHTLPDIAALLRGKPVYVTLDIDVLDPSCVPGTGTPEPGGVSFHDILRALQVLKGMHIAGGDLVELAPCLDPSGASTAVACKLMREFLLAMG